MYSIILLFTYLRVRIIMIKCMKKCQRFVVYQLKVRLLFSEVMEACHIARVSFSDKTRTLT